MQTTSATWKTLWASGSALLEVKAVIGGTDRSAEICAAPVIRRATMQNGLSVGNVVSATCTLTLRTTAAIARSASAALSMRLTDGTTASEWLPAGTFYISRRAKDPVTGLLTLECYDALLKANAAWAPSAGSWPRAMSSVVSELATLLGVSVDSRTTLITGASYVIDEPTEGTSIRDVLSDIAACNGGNWIITPEGKLRLVPLTSAAGAGDAVSDALDVEAVLDRGTLGDTAAITGVRCTVDGVVTLTGDDTGIVVDVDIAPVIAADLAQTLIGMTHQPFRLPSAVYDPAVELGDYVRYNSTVAGVLCAETAILSAGPRGELSAPDPAELADEYPYIGGTEKALTLAKAYAREAVEALDDDLTQQEIFDRLTDNGAAQGMVLVNGQLYINASYIHSGTLVLGGLNNQNGTMQVLDASGNVVGTWTKDGVVVNKGSMTLTSIRDNHSVILCLSESQTEPFKISSSGANVDYETIADGSLIDVKDNVNDLNVAINSSALTFSDANGVRMYLSNINGQCYLRLLSTNGNDVYFGNNAYVTISGAISLRSNNAAISLYSGTTLDMHSGGDASLYLTDTGHVEIRSDGGAAYLQLKADGTIYVNNAAEWRSALAITPANIGAVATSDIIDIPHGGTGQSTQDGMRNAVFYNTSTTGISSYPNTTGLFRLTGTLPAGMPSGANAYGVLTIVGAGGYFTHRYVDAAHNVYYAYSSAAGAPTTWRKLTSTTVSPVT